MSNEYGLMKNRSALVVIFQAAITAGCLYFVTRQVDWTGLRHSLLRVDVGMLLVGILFLCCQPIVGTLRWRAITTALGGHLGLTEGAALTYLGMFFNQALPASVGGDAVKVWLMHRHEHGLRLAFNSVVLDRVFMLSGLFVLVAAGLSFVEYDFLGLRYLIGIAIILTGAGFALVCLADLLPDRLRQSRLYRLIAAVSADTRTVLFSPWAMMKLAALIVLSYASMTISLFAIILSFGEKVEFWTAMALLPTVLLASVAPVSIGGWGAREAATVGILGLVGVSAQSALGASVIFGVCSFLVTLPGLWLYVMHRRQLKDVAALEVVAPAAAVDRSGT